MCMCEEGHEAVRATPFSSFAHSIRGGRGGRERGEREGRTKETLVVTVAHNVCSRSNSSQKGSAAAAAVFLASGKCSP